MPEDEPAKVEAVEISCPACKSRITSDGKELREKSSHMEKLEAKAEAHDDLKTRYGDLKSECDRLKALLAKVAEEQQPEKPSAAESKPQREGVVLW